MKAKQIIRNSVMWKTWIRTVWDCNDASYFVTDSADRWESRVLLEGILDLNGWDFIEEAMK